MSVSDSLHNNYSGALRLAVVFVLDREERYDLLYTDQHCRRAAIVASYLAKQRRTVRCTFQLFKQGRSQSKQ